MKYEIKFDGSLKTMIKIIIICSAIIILIILNIIHYQKVLKKIKED